MLTWAKPTKKPRNQKKKKKKKQEKERTKKDNRRKKRIGGKAQEDRMFPPHPPNTLGNHALRLIFRVTRYNEKIRRASQGNTLNQFLDD